MSVCGTIYASFLCVCLSKHVIKYVFAVCYWAMRAALTVEVNFAVGSIYITSLWDVLLGVFDRQTAHQAQQAKKHSQHVSSSRPTVSPWPMKRAAVADKTQICWVSWSQSWPSTVLTCSQNTEKTAGCTEGHNSLLQLFYKFTGN